MKNKIKFTIYALLGLFFSAQGQTNTARNVFFVQGIGVTSNDWTYFYNNAQANGYLMQAMDAVSEANYQPQTNTVSVSADQLNNYLQSNNKSNVLGIGHDGGGIVLRKMVNDLDTRLTGIILDGVPNQGSNALEQLVAKPGQTLSDVERLIARLEDLRSETNDCTLCDVLGMFKTFNSEIKVNSERYKEFFPGSATMNSLGLPIKPYAVLWGNANKDNFTLDRMLSSWTDAASGVYEDKYYVDCIKKKLDAKREELKNAQVDQLIAALSGFFRLSSSYLSIVDSNGNVNTSSLTTFLADVVDFFGKEINRARKIDEEVANLLECELLRNILNATWNIIVSGGYTATFTTVTTTIQLTPEECCWQCFGEPEDQIDACLADCYNNNDCVKTLTTVTTAVLTTKPHDGLYSKEEQLLAGAANTYELSQTNHFQEQSWAHTYQRYQLLFDGQNMAFKVPK